MAFTRTLVAAVTLAVSLLGVTAPGVPAATSGTSGMDPACLKALKDRGYGYTERHNKCAIKFWTVYKDASTTTSASTRAVRPAGTVAYDEGHWNWKVGNFLWEFTIETSYRKVAFPPHIGGWTWQPLSAICWKNFTRIITLRITACPEKGWDLGGGLRRMGAYFETELGPVTEGFYSYIHLENDHAAAGIYQGHR